MASVVGINRKSPLESFVIALLYVFFALFTLMCLFPFYYLIINSISANDMSARGDIMFYPRNVHFKNYINVMTVPGLPMAALVSLGRTVLGTGLTVMGSSFLGFMFTQQKLWGRKFWYRFVVATMYFSAGLIPWYLTMRTLHFTNNFLAYIIPSIVQPFNIILIKTYIENTPIELQEAAEVDGASIMYIFTKIILPISTPILATVAIFAAVGQWNAFMDTLILMTDPKLYSLQFLLYKYLNEARSLIQMIAASGGSITDGAINSMNAQTTTSIQMTIAVVVVIPILLVYPVFQRFFVKGIMIGAVKG
ncbi:sugar ABC transporter permease [Spirochaetia bacterium]|nr:sugar ABC transporter permease [Spirochaetia bacterium]GHV04577.1 sugar ABC transporter permease [Spirochaetia bacterium]